MKLQFIVTKKDEEKLLKTILKEKMYISSRLLTRLKLNNNIFVNNIATNVNYILKENDIVTVDLTNSLNNKDFSDKFILLDKPLNILYEDEYILVVNKEKNMPIHPSSNNYENTLSNIVANYLKKQGINSIHIVTRLDHNTTGIVIFAKNEYIQELFIRKKDEINLQKEYIAIVNNIVKKDHDIINSNIARKKDTIILREVNEKGDYAKTEYFCLKRNYSKNYSILKIILHTGRTHQIRVHMSHINHTLLGDELYANESEKTIISKYILRQALHAYKVSFNHPITNEKIVLTCDIPYDMKLLYDDSKNV